MPVEILGKHADSPATGLKDCVEGLEKQGAEIVGVVQFFEETCVIYRKPKRETRTRPASEKRG